MQNTNYGVENLRIGTGFDVHEFVEGRPLMIGGIDIPYEKGLLGHSDADVLLHAIVDAILGALAMGDIGQHFPPTDAKWKNAPSSTFVEYTRDLVLKRKGKILSIDCTLISEYPKLSPHYTKMRQKISALLELPYDRIHLKATTTEKLGFLGRGEGIAAQAVCLLALGEDNLSFI